MDEFLKILSLILISSVKFAVGPPLAYMNEKYDFTWLETNLYAVMGGMIGVIVFMHVSEWLFDIWETLRLYFFRRKERRKLRRKQLFSPPVADANEQFEIHYQYVGSPPPHRKVFTPRTRRMVRIWKNYGLIGLAALTPVLFSIPIGTFFMTRLEKNRKKILLYMFISITCWSLLITTAFEIFHARSIHEILK
ncbi:MAG: hypothetical protein IT242_04695 [Bacteroidia bacterium]|nr:hypothetical protein [Bacteroidia bacterium]